MTTYADEQTSSTKRKDDHSDAGRILDRIRASREKMVRFAEVRKSYIDAYCGESYGEVSRLEWGGYESGTIAHIIRRTVDTYVNVLTPDNPQVMVSTDTEQYRPSAKNLELAINHLMTDIKFGDTLRQCVMDGIFGLCAVKHGMAMTPGDDPEIMIPGQPFVDVVLFEDFVVDMTARSWTEVDFIGNTYRVPWAEFQENVNAGWYLPSREVLKRLVPTHASDTNYDDQGIPKSNEAQGGTNVNDDQKKYIELIDVYFPKENMVRTVTTCSNTHLLLDEFEWNGPKSGPYSVLMLGNMPSGNIMPVSIIDTIWDIHNVTNEIMKTAAEQAVAAKKVGIAPNNADPSDIESINRLKTGAVYGMKGPAVPQELKLGGADPLMFQSVDWMTQKANYYGGNPDLISGSRAQTDTVGQERILSRGADSQIQAMSSRIMDFVLEIAKSLAFYLWTDPLIDLPLTKRVKTEGYEIAVKTRFNADTRQGDFLDYNFEIDPYSRQRMTPAAKMQTLLGLWSQVIAPMLPMAAQQGMSVKFERFIEELSRLSQLPELQQILEFQQGAVQEDSGVETMRSPVTQRTNVRMDRGGGEPDPFSGASMSGAE